MSAADFLEPFSRIDRAGIMVGERVAPGEWVWVDFVLVPPEPPWKAAHARRYQRRR